MTKDTGTNGTLKIRRSTLELILIALLGAGGGGGAAKMLLPDKGAAAQDYAVVQQTLEEIKAEGTPASTRRPTMRRRTMRSSAPIPP